MDLVIHDLSSKMSKKVKSLVKGHITLLFLSEVHIKLSELPDIPVVCVKIGATASSIAGGASPSVSASSVVRMLKYNDETGTVSALGAICGCSGR